jgi:cell division protein ZapA (FtsZ GTPase activity inhibitor)
MVPRQVIKQAIRVRMMGGMMVSYVVVALQQKTRKIAGRLGAERASPAAVTSAR